MPTNATLGVTTTKPKSSVEFYKDVDVMNHVLNEYILSGNLIATTRKSDDDLTVTTTLHFSSTTAMHEFLADPVITEFGKAKKTYNHLHKIVTKTEIINE